MRDVIRTAPGIFPAYIVPRVTRGNSVLGFAVRVCLSAPRVAHLLASKLRGPHASLLAVHDASTGDVPGDVLGIPLGFTPRDARLFFFRQTEMELAPASARVFPPGVVVLTRRARFWVDGALSNRQQAPRAVRNVFRPAVPVRVRGLPPLDIEVAEIQPVGDFAVHVYARPVALRSIRGLYGVQTPSAARRLSPASCAAGVFPPVRHGVV
mmetsp:Transcript_9732/g.40877  ORF Transcript_9732/g.40877 Transcript_9732/m.40877 type:complete len:210 (+) Transcript_9732:388-1017(+)